MKKPVVRLPVDLVRVAVRTQLRRGYTAQQVARLLNLDARTVQEMAPPRGSVGADDIARAQKAAWCWRHLRDLQREHGETRA